MDLECGPAPDLTVSIFRIGGDEDNSINQRFVEALHKDGRVFLSSTKIRGKLWVRCAIVSHRTHLKEVDIALDMIRKAVTELTQST